MMMAGFHSNANSRRSNLMRKVLLENLFGALTYYWEEASQEKPTYKY